MQARRLLALACIVAAAVSAAGCSSDDAAGDGRPVVRVGVLEFGTVNWELDTVKRLHLAAKHGIRIKVLPLASENALAVALQGDEVDLIVSDWLWVARQRAEDHRYQFAPYSKAVGAIMVDPGSGVRTLAGLRGHQLGIAGGPVDKTWLLARAYARKIDGFDLEDAVEPVYAAPPMINRLLLKQDVSAAINFWHYNARAAASGMHRLISVEQMLHGMGIDTVPPLLGWVFSESWARDHHEALEAFLAATYDAKHALADSDAAWTPLRARIKPENDAVFAAIRRGYRAGIVQHYGAADIAAAGKLFDIIAAEGGGQLTGGVSHLSPDVFWDGFRLP